LGGAEAQIFFEGFDVDVAGAVFDGLDQDQVGEFDDGGFFAGGGELVEVDFFEDFLGDFELVGVVGVLFLGVEDDVFHAGAFGGVECGKFVEDGFFGGDERGDFELGDAADVVNGQDVQGVGHGDEEFVVEARDGEDFVVLDDFVGEEVGDVGGDGKAEEVDGRHVEDAAHRDGEVLFADVGFFDDEFDEARAFLLLLFEEFLDLLGGEEAVFDEGVGDAFSESFGGGEHGGLAENFLEVFHDVHR
jgi:hypothetical protein